MFGRDGADAYPPEFEWEMAISRSEFERSLNDAVGGGAFVVDGNAYSWNDGMRSWRIELEPLPDRVIALLRLPRHRVRFTLSGYSEGERCAWVERFARYFQRGGG